MSEAELDDVIDTVPHRFVHRRAHGLEIIAVNEIDDAGHRWSCPGWRRSDKCDARRGERCSQQFGPQLLFDEPIGVADIHRGKRY